MELTNYSPPAASMTLAIALFVSTVLVLAVYHKEFRRVVFWVAPITAMSVGIFSLSVHLYHRHEAKQRAEADRKFKVCMARFPVPYILPDGERMNAFAIASACTNNPDFAPDPDSSFLAKVLEIHGGGTLHITPPQRFSPEGDPDVIPVIYLGHHQTFVLKCGNYGEPETSILFNQALVSCPESPAPACAQENEKHKPDKWGKYIELSLRDCTKNGCVVYNGKRIVGGLSRNEITSAQWDNCG